MILSTSTITRVHDSHNSNSGWNYGHGGTTRLFTASASSTSITPTEKTEANNHISINPHSPERNLWDNYRLLISAIAPRPIALISTVSADGKSVNLAPYSYFNVIAHDPPTFVVGFGNPPTGPKDSFINIRDTRQCVINVVSEDFLEAANAASIDAPYGMSEWSIAGLTADYCCETVKAPRVKESIFSIEAKVESIKEIQSREHPGRISSWMIILEGTRFWARDDALNEEQDYIYPEVCLNLLHRLLSLLSIWCFFARIMPLTTLIA
jgi:flavin reductase (DIM6/NTAB) family NADH-FMN oxidoreductase RutF